jgi:uncharacterized NAD-dependent epimerase/dehydratase family protein
MKKYIVILADGKLQPVFSKTESALIRYSRDHILGIIDPVNAGKTVNEVLGFGGEIPIAGTLDEFFHLNPNYLFIGTALYGGNFLMEWYPMIIKAIQSKLNIINGLHQSLLDIAEFNLLAKKYRTKIIDLRHVEDKFTKYKGVTHSIKSKKILVAGTNDLSGKLSTTIEVVTGLHRQGSSADWLPTSLAGTQIKKKGQIIESMNSDQVSGYVEYELYEMNDKFEYLFVEGRGSLRNQLLAPAMMGILHGTAPHGVLLCHRMEESLNINLILRSIEFYQNLLQNEKTPSVIAVSVNSSLVEENKALELLASIEEKCGIPATDPVRFGTKKLTDGIKSYFRND